MNAYPPALDREQLAAALRTLVRQHATGMTNRDLGTEPAAWAWEALLGAEGGGVCGRAVNTAGRLCTFLTFRNRTWPEYAAAIRSVCGSLPLLVDTTGVGAALLDALREQGVLADAIVPAGHRAPQAPGSICAVISYCGRKGEPLACAFPPEHAGAHAWATLPTWNGPPVPRQTAAAGAAAAEIAGIVL